MRSLVGLVAVLAFIFAAGCDLVSSERQPLTAGPSGVVAEKRAPDPADAGGSEAAPAIDAISTDASGPPPTPGTYEAMCRHYCETLQETDMYACLVSADANDCASRFMGIAVECLDLRCASKLVQPSLCLTQCDALTMNESSYCKAGPADAAVCASSPTAQNDACRADCTVDSP
jgi:hypothetical protein